MFLRYEALPFAADAWGQADRAKVEYEIGYTRYFHEPKPIRMLAEILAEILALEQETEEAAGKNSGARCPGLDR